MRVAAVGQKHAVCKHRLDQRRLRRRLPSKPFARAAFPKTCHGADGPGQNLIGRLVFCAGINADLIGLVLPNLFIRHPAAAVRHKRLDAQDAARHLQVRQTRAALIARHLENSRAERRRIIWRARIAAERRKQFIHTAEPERRPEKAREQPPLADQPGKRPVRNCPAFKILLQHGFVAHGRLLAKRFARRAEIDASAVQTAAQLVEQRRAVRPGKIHFIDKQEHGHTAALQKAPEGQRMALHTVRPADHKHRVIEHGKRALHFAGKIDMARCVEQRQLCPVKRQDRLL